MYGSAHRNILDIGCGNLLVRIAQLLLGGRGGIRTHEGLAPLAVFKTAALNHSATLPGFWHAEVQDKIAAGAGIVPPS
jgi:hypothetical protein